MTQKTGLPPGSLVHMSKLKSEEVSISVVKYNSKTVIEASPNKIETALKSISPTAVTWININGINKADIIEKIGNALDIHPLVLEDIMTARQRPKFEEHDKYLFIVLRVMYYTEKGNQIDEQISMLLGKNYVITFQETNGNVFRPVKERLEAEKGRIRRHGPDFLAYSLMDAIVDNYFIVADALGERSESIETDLLRQHDEKIMEKIFKVKSDLSLLKKAIWPLRDLVSKIEKHESKLITKITKVYLRDIQDHTVQIIDTVEMMRDRNSSMADIHLSNMSNKMNEVMKVLTIIATIFIPLTFITGLYGMNFDYMPEIHSPLGYPIVIGVMIVLAGIMLLYFKRKKWI